MPPTPLRDRADKPKGEIGARLDLPAHVVDAATLAAIWRQGIVTWRLGGLAPLITDAGLPGRNPERIRQPAFRLRIDPVARRCALSVDAALRL